MFDVNKMFLMIILFENLNTFGLLSLRKDVRLIKPFLLDKSRTHYLLSPELITG
jgi:hypothetical protein